MFLLQTTPERPVGLPRGGRCVLCHKIIGRLRRNSLPTDQRDPGEFPYRTNNSSFTFCHKKWPEVRIVTSGLPKNLARFFVRTCGCFACFCGSHDRFYMAKRQGYVASRSQAVFRAIFCHVIIRLYEDEKEQKICPPALDYHHHAAIGRVMWRNGNVMRRS